jgi:hypothetical protein
VSDSDKSSYTLILPFLRSIVLGELALVPPSSEKSANRDIKRKAYQSYYDVVDDIPTELVCFLLKVSLPTQFVTCSHIFQKRWEKYRHLIKLDDVHSPKNIIFLFKPIEIAFDSGRLIFLWDGSVFRMRVLDPSLRICTVESISSEGIDI